MKFSSIFFKLILILLTSATLVLSAEIRDVTIGLVIDGISEDYRQITAVMKSEILDLTKNEFNVRFPEDKQINAQWQVPRIIEAVDNLLLDPQVDMIITIGSISSNEVCHRGPLPKPVIAPYVLDAMLQNLPLKNGTSGIKNLNYISVPATFRRDFLAFRDIVWFENLAIIMHQYWLDKLSDSDQYARNLFQDLGLHVQFIGFENDAKNALNQLNPETEAVYLLPLPNLSDSEMKRLIDSLIERKLPSFSIVGDEIVEKGVMAGLNKGVTGKIARRVALNVQRILLGDSPESIPVAISMKKQLTVNMITANAIGVYPSWAIMTEAEVIRADKSDIERKLDLNSAVQEAILANLELAVKGYYVEAGKQEVNIARSKLLPAIDVSGNYLVIDPDRADASLGQQPERTLNGSITATQVIYSEPAWANFSIQRKLQNTREYDLETLKLDITELAATAYLNVLRAKTYEKTQQNNLKVTRQNLELARVRETIGSAGPAEVYRWESEVALNRKSVIEANAQRNLAEIQLNRLLHRPAEESFATTEADINAPYLITSNLRLLKFIEGLKAFKVFRNFMVEEAFNNSPELASLNEAIQIQRRILNSATNSFWQPTIALQGQVNNVFSRSGKGTEANLELPPSLPFEFSFPQPKDLSWNVGLNVSFPLFSGGEKFAQRQKAIKELAKLELEKEMVTEQLEQRIRSALHKAGASYASIRQAQIASESAGKSLAVVQDAYSQGMVTLVELLDAQNAALIADQFAANAVYDFLIDLMAVQRGLGRFDFFSTMELRNEFLQRADEYFEKEGIVIE